MTPEHVVDAWRARISLNDDYQRRQHVNNDHYQPFDTCWKCTRQRAICRSKVRFESIEEAHEVADKVNHPSRERLIVPYICRWGSDLHFHNRTANSSAARRRARKRMSRILR